MKHCVIPAALAALLLLAASAHATAVEDSLAAMSDSARVALIFPFEVGQVYQFKASGDFTRPNGEVLPAYTVAEVTITDTVINDVTWLKIPYWNPFGTELYSLNEDSNVVMYVYSSSGNCAARLFDLSDVLWPNGMGSLTHLPYTFAGYGLLWGDPIYGAHESSGWLVLPTESSEESALILNNDVRQDWRWIDDSHQWTWGINAWHGRYGPGSSLHGAGHTYASEVSGVGVFTYSSTATWGLFRAKCDDAWPEFDPMETTGVEEPREGEQRPTEMAIRAYPNPFNPSVTISYVVPQAGDTRVDVFSIAGQRVRSLADGPHVAGAHGVVWNGLDDSGRAAGSGVYLVRFATQGKAMVTRITLVR